MGASKLFVPYKSENVILRNRTVRSAAFESIVRRKIPKFQKP